MTLAIEKLMYAPIETMDVKDIVGEILEITLRNLYRPAQRGLKHVQYVRDETRYCTLQNRLKNLSLIK